MSKKIIIYWISLFMALPGTVWGELKFLDAQFSELAVNSRALAMGNAFIAKANDATSVFYNPAGLGSIKKWQFHLSNIHIEWNKNWMNSSSGGKLIEAVSSFPSAFSMDGLRELQLGVEDKPTHSRFNIAPNFTMRYFSAGYLYSMQTRTQINSTGDFEYADRTDHGPYVAGNISLFGGILKFGAMGIILMRKEAIGSQDSALTINLEDGDYTTGTAPLINAGMKFTLPIVGLPTFAARFNNVNSAEFHGSQPVPSEIKNSIDVGFSITPKLSNIVDWHLEVNYKDANNKFPELASLRRIQAGMEIGVAHIIFFRTGLADGYGSFGLGMRTKKLKVDISTYSIDLSDDGIRGQEDRRFSFTISSGI